MNLPLNEVFLKNSREYGMNQLIAAKYQPGMETGFLVCYCYKSQEGYRFFDNRQQAEEFVKLKPLQDLLVDGRWEKVSCVYHAPDPVLHARFSPIEKKINEVYNLNLKGNFREDEADEYQFVILEPGVWIIRDFDGNVRVWSPLSEDLFMGRDYICIKDHVQELEKAAR